MKRLPVILWLLLALPALGAEVKISWDPAPPGETWQYVRVYERTGTAGTYVYTKVAEVPGTATEATVTAVPPGVHVYVARSFNVWESVDSNSVATPMVPVAPQNIRFTITITVSGTSGPP